MEWLLGQVALGSGLIATGHANGVTNLGRLITIMWFFLFIAAVVFGTRYVTKGNRTRETKDRERAKDVGRPSDRPL